ncbi:MAG: hypothetical protein JKX85_09435 [Phycisphaeraceae bacterium]|nr:hypothetical protein [Phycisphaeraceae bacterium]
MKPFESKTLSEKLNHLLQLHRGSLIRHLNEAQPYLSARTYQAWQQLQELQDHRQQRTEQIVYILDLLCDSRPLPNVYEQSVAFFHFLSLDALLPHLLENLNDIHQNAVSLLPCGHADIDLQLKTLIQSLESDIQSVLKAMQAISAMPLSVD